MVFKHVLLQAGLRAELLVAPEDLLRVRAEDHHGDRRGEHRRLVRRGHVVGHVVDIALDGGAALFARLPEVKIQREHHQQLRNAQRLLPRGEGARREQQRTDEVQPHTRLGQLCDPFCHRDHAPLFQRIIIEELAVDKV